MKKSKRVFYVVIIVILAGCAFLHFLPVRWEAGACGGGYKSYIYNKYIGELVSLYADSHSEYPSVAAKTSSEYSVTWKGRNMYFDVELDVIDKNGNKNTVFAEFVGKRFWIEKFTWKER